MHCRNCNKELPDGTNFCLYCGTNQVIKQVQEVQPLNQVTPQPAGNQQQSVVDKQKDNNHLANILCTISLGLYFIPIAIAFATKDIRFSSTNNPLYIAHIMMSFITPLSIMAAHVLMIIARVKCPKSTYAKVVMWIYIGIFNMLVIMAIVFIVYVGSSIISCCNDLSQNGLGW